MQKKRVLLYLVLFLFFSSTVFAISFNEAYNIALKEITITPTTAVDELPELGRQQSIYEYFTGLEIFNTGNNEYYVFLADFMKGMPDGHPKHIIFVNKKTGNFLKIYLEFPPADKQGEILPIKKTIIKPEQYYKTPTKYQTIELKEYALIDLNQKTNHQHIQISGFLTATSHCPIKCEQPLLDDRKPAKKFMIFIKGYDHNGAFDNSWDEAKDCDEEKYDEELVLSPYYYKEDMEKFPDLYDKAKYVDPLPDGKEKYKQPTGYNNLEDIKKKIAEMSSKICCSDQVTIYIAAHGMAYFTINLSDSLDPKTNRLYFDFVDQLLNKFLDSEWNKKLSEEELQKLGLTYEEYSQLSSVIPLLAKIYLGQELPEYQLRNLAEAIKNLENKIEFPDWFTKMFESMIGCLELGSSGIQELINECIEKEFKEATKAKIKTRHQITGKKGQSIDTGYFVNSGKEILSCNKKMVIDSCYGGVAAQQAKGLITIAPSRYISYISKMLPSMCDLLRSCKELVPIFFGEESPLGYEVCMNSLYRCEEPWFSEISNTNYIKSKFTEEEIQEILNKQKERCDALKNYTIFTEQNFKYIEALECECCSIDYMKYLDGTEKIPFGGDLERPIKTGIKTIDEQQEHYEQPEEDPLLVGGAIKMPTQGKESIIAPILIVIILAVFVVLMMEIMKKKKETKINKRKK